MAIRSPDKERLYGTDEAMAKGIIEMIKTSAENAKTMSDLNDPEVGYLSLLETIADELGLEVLKKFNQNFCQYRVSRFRLGRREIGGVLTFAGAESTGRVKSRSIRDLFSGIR